MNWHVANTTDCFYDNITKSYEKAELTVKRSIDQDAKQLAKRIRNVISFIIFKCYVRLIYIMIHFYHVECSMFAERIYNYDLKQN